MFSWFQNEIIILRNNLVKLHIPTYFGWLQDFARTHRFQIHVCEGQIIILLLRKCYYFHVNYYLIICHVLSVILLLHYSSIISRKKNVFCYMRIVQKSMLVLWYIRQDCFCYCSVISGVTAELKNPRNRLEHPLIWQKHRTNRWLLSQKACP